MPTDPDSRGVMGRRCLIDARDPPRREHGSVVLAATRDCPLLTRGSPDFDRRARSVVHTGFVRRRLRLLLLLGVLVVGCTNGRDRASPDTSVPRPSLPSTDHGPIAAAALDCRNPIATDTAVPETYEQLAGVTALPTSTSSPVALQTSPSSESLRLFAKTGLLIRAGVEFTIAPSAEWSGRAAAWWGNSGGVRIAPSSQGGPCGGTGWLAFPGGFFVAEPGCVPFEIQAANTRLRVEIGMGAPCPGQQPPPEPSTR
jgi:hypothetical protein